LGCPADSVHDATIARLPDRQMTVMRSILCRRSAFYRLTDFLVYGHFDHQAQRSAWRYAVGVIFISRRNARRKERSSLNPTRFAIRATDRSVPTEESFCAKHLLFAKVLAERDVTLRTKAFPKGAARDAQLMREFRDLWALLAHEACAPIPIDMRTHSCWCRTHGGCTAKSRKRCYGVVTGNGQLLPS